MGFANALLPSGARTQSGNPGQVLSNEGAELAGIGRGLSRMLTGYIIAFAALLIVLVVALGSVATTLAVVGGVAALFFAMLAVNRAAARGDRRYIPTTIAIFPDRVEGSFAIGARNPPAQRTLTIPFAAISAISPAGNSGGREHFWIPATVRTDYARIARFEPTSVRGLIRGPPVPPGCAGRFILATRNFEPLKVAYLRAYPDSKIYEDGSVHPQTE